MLHIRNYLTPRELLGKENYNILCEEIIHNLKEVIKDKDSDYLYNSIKGIIKKWSKIKER